ncbi:malate dehydrogenase [bacterium]|nr:malate dehydrogenase [bacterium]
MKQKALDYHRYPQPGKIAIIPTKPCKTQEDLALAYTPGVASVCEEIAKNPESAYLYTGKANSVAVITDGTAVLGLGNIGPLASKPVMEGKSLLFKQFANIDSVDIELNTSSPEETIAVIAAMADTFGGINLEDIASPHCFEIEKKLIEMLDIPVFHDDQHGTAVIAGAGVLNGLEIANKSIKTAKIVISGAGAAGVSIHNHLILLGAEKSNIFVYDKDGVLFEGRKEQIGPWHKQLFKPTSARTLAELMKDADVFIGVSVGNIVTADMVASMAIDPIIFPMANPTPEIDYNTIMATRKDAIAGTGRSDFPNQVNNVLGFPAIFRGALDVRASKITEGMKTAATHALANLAKLPVPEEVLKPYGLTELSFGRDYIIPKPFDPRVVIEVSKAVAQAAIAEGIARTT